MKKFKNFCINNQEILWAAGLLLIVVILIYNCALNKVYTPFADGQGGIEKIRGIYIVLSVLFTLTAGAVAFFTFTKKEFYKKHIVKLSVALTALFGFVYIFIMPPFSCCDEKYHLLGAYHMSNIMMGVSDDTAARHAYVRAEDAEFLLNEKPGIDDYGQLVNGANYKGKADDELVLFEDEKYYDCFYLGYLPQAIAITIARLIGIKQLPMMLLARMFSLMTFLIFFWLAMRKMPFGREILSLIALFPMLLELIAGISYDGIVLGMSFYFIAYVLDLAFMADKVRTKDMIILTAVMAFLAPVKIVYMLITFLMFIIPKEKFGSTKKYVISALCMAAVIGVVFLIVRMGKIQEYAAGDNTALDWIEGDSYTMAQILSDPGHTIKVLVNTFWYFGGQWFENMIGAQLGWVDIQAPAFIIIGFAVMMLLAVIKPAEEPVYYTAKHRVISWVMFGIMSLLIVISMMAAWTPSTYPMVVGVQGRYFLPILPIAMLAVRGGTIRRNENTNVWILYGAILLNILSFVNVFGTVMERMGQ